MNLLSIRHDLAGNRTSSSSYLTQALTQHCLIDKTLSSLNLNTGCAMSEAITRLVRDGQVTEDIILGTHELDTWKDHGPCPPPAI
jgi:hypothetical protein